MSYSNKALLIAAILAVVEARFGQEQGPVAAFQALNNVGQPGEAATLAGGIPGVLLAAANPCDKLTLADKFVTQLGDSQEVVDAAKELVAAEQNFNPFAVSVPNICGDASLPATEALRGIVPLVDPAVTGADTENANSATSKTTPFDATGLSVAEVMQAQGFSNFTTAGAAGGAAAGGNANAGNNNNNNNQNQNQNNGNANNNNNQNNNNNANAGNDNANANTGNDAADCGNTGNANTGNNNNNANTGNNNANTGNNNANTGNASNNTGNANTGNANNGNANTGNNNAGNNNGNAGGAAGGATGAADFGKCTPTMDFQLGRGNRKATEGTFLPTDPLVAQGQQDALNPNIITNRICDQLTNVCEANDAAKTQCKDAQAQIQASGDRSAAVADTWNSLLGF